MVDSNNLSQRILDSLLTPDVTDKILQFSLPEGVDERLSVLRTKANQGTLTPEERAEYQQFVDTLDMLGDLRVTAKAAAERQAS